MAKRFVPASAAWLFPEYDFTRMTPGHYAPVIIERILERGSAEEVKWLLQAVGQAAVADWVARHGYRRLSKKKLGYWCWVLGVKELRRPPWVEEPGPNG